MSEEKQLVNTEDTKNVSNLDLINILVELLDVESKVNDLKLELKLKESNVDFIRFMLSNFPDCFDKISTSLNIVLEDGKLDVSDVPILVNLIKDVVKNNSKPINQIKKVSVEELIDFIRNIIEILIHKDFIKVENKEKVFKLIFVSVELLNTSIDVSQNLWDFIKKCFKW